MRSIFTLFLLRDPHEKCIAQDGFYARRAVGGHCDHRYTPPNYTAPYNPPFYLPYGDYLTCWSGTGTPNPGVGTPINLYLCPADSRNLKVEDEDWGYGCTTPTAFTEYLGVAGFRLPLTPTSTNPTGVWTFPLAENADGALYIRSKVRITDMTDGASNTFIVGERPPSADLVFGWWFAGFGYDRASGRGDVVLGPREYH